MTENNYFSQLSAKQAEYEQVTGASFESFVNLCRGDKYLAALYFGQAYWKARGVTKYDKFYTDRIAAHEDRVANPQKYQISQKTKTDMERSKRIKAGQEFDQQLEPDQ